MGSNETVLLETGTLGTFLGKERKTEEMRQEIIKDETCEEYTGAWGRVKIRNLGTGAPG